MKKTVRVVNENRLTQYIAGIVLFTVILASIAAYLFIQKPSYVPELHYAELPEMIINVGGHVAKLKMTVQAGKDDDKWLLENKNEINNIFQKKVASMNPESLRNAKGMAAAQLALKRQINTDLKTDKVQAVWFTELLLQQEEY
jgi:flagellar basal body-associated protein FliL